MLRVRLLGGLALELDGERLDPPASRRARSLLAWLALNPGAHPRSQLAARFWPDVLDSSARASLRTALHELRRALRDAGARHVIATRERVSLDGGADLWVDARAFEELAVTDRLEEALALRGGELLAGLDEEWVYEARDRHRDVVLSVLERLALAEERSGDRSIAARWTREQVELDPLSEELHRRLIRRLADAGDRSAALAAYERMRERLRKELRITPSPETRRLVERLREQDPAEPSGGAPAERRSPQLPGLLRRHRRSGFVDRVAELERLGEQLDAVSCGERRLVVVAGEPGIGKTRLATEFCRRAHGRGATILFGRCFEERLVPYQAFVEALGQHVTATPLAELRSRVGAADAELVDLVPELAVRLPELSAPVRLDPEGARWRLFAAVDRLLSSASQAGPAVVALDDLHWGDKATLLLLAHVARSPEPARLLLLGTYRESEVSPAHPLRGMLANLRREGLVERVALGGLEQAHVGELVADWFGRDAAPDLERRLHEQTDGNPFFVEELLRQFGEIGELARHEVPEGVKEVIAHRLARLGESCRQVLSVAAGVGRQFDLELLERLEELAGRTPLPALEEAMAAQMIREDPARVGRYNFAHALIRETLYEDLSLTRRVRLHAAIAAALEELHAGRLDAHLVELAHHHLAAAPGGETASAVAYAVRAAESARGKLAYEEAAELYERALDALDREQRPPAAQRAGLLLALGEARLRAGTTSAARRAFASAADLARALGDHELLGRAALGFSGLGVTIIAVDADSVALLEEALEVAEPGALRARLLARLAIETYYAAAPSRRKALGDEAVQTARRARDAPALIDALNARHVALWSPAYLEERLDTATEMVELAERQGEPERAMQGRNWRVLDLAERGDIEGMRREVERHEELAERLRLPAYQWWGPMWRSTLAILEGSVREAERLLDEFRSIGERAEDANAELYFDVQRQTLLLERERFEELDLSMLERQTGGPAETAYRCGYSWAFAGLGRASEARELVDWVARRDFARLPEDMNLLASLCELTQACVLLGYAEHAAGVYERLLPYAGRNVINARAAAGYGAADHHLGALAALMRRSADAERHYEDALCANGAMGARPWLARTQLRYAELLRERGRPADRRRAENLVSSAVLTARELGLEALANRAEARLADIASAARELG